MVRYAYDFESHEGVLRPDGTFMTRVTDAACLKYGFGVVFCLVLVRAKVCPRHTADICLDIRRESTIQRILLVGHTCR